MRREGGLQVHHVIVGNGVAGMEAALELRRREPDARITVVSEESDHFFSRTALMYVAAGQLAHRDMEPLERDVYARMRFERVRARAVGLDRANRQLQLAGQPPLTYDRLLLAVGSRARPAPWPGAAELLGVGHLVTLQDLNWFQRELHGDEGHDQPERPWAHAAHSAPDSPYRRRDTARERRASPRAKNAAERSSTITVRETRGCRAKANAKGVERDPGDRTTCARPRRDRVSTSTLLHSVFVVRRSNADPRSAMGKG
jgi:NADPH-dependent 2,4-dienoyl-CoA reductase/sulfur reductase-like enzyme